MDVITRVMTQEMKWIKAIKKKSSEQAANQLISKFITKFLDLYINRR
ncbi:hypothetical protein [Virgibacillus pantothenticus]|nr:hypothetical protein [Virgibacillus pantothenticus]